MGDWLNREDWASLSLFLSSSLRKRKTEAVQVAGFMTGKSSEKGEASSLKVEVTSHRLNRVCIKEVGHCG